MCRWHLVHRDVSSLHDEAAAFAICISTVEDGFNNVSSNQKSNPRLELPVSAGTEWDTFTGPSKSRGLRRPKFRSCLRKSQLFLIFFIVFQITNTKIQPQAINMVDLLSDALRENYPPSLQLIWTPCFGFPVCIFTVLVHSPFQFVAAGKSPLSITSNRQSKLATSLKTEKLFCFFTLGATFICCIITTCHNPISLDSDCLWNSDMSLSV